MMTSQILKSVDFTKTQKSRYLENKILFFLQIIKFIDSVSKANLRQRNSFVAEVTFSKFILLLRKGVYPYEYMDSWERFDETSLPDKEAFYSSLNMEDVTDVDHRHAKRVFKKLNNKNLDDYHDLYVQSTLIHYINTLLLAGVFEHFTSKCIEIHELDPAHFLSAPGLAWQACLKKTGIKLELLTNVGMLLMVGKGITGGICHAIHWYAEANNKYMKNYDKNKESSYVKYLDANNLYG